MIRHTCDTSVLVPGLLAAHPDHAAARAGLRNHDLVLTAHVVLETYSVLTRLPAPYRFAPRDALALLSPLASDPLGLPGDRHQSLLSSLVGSDVRGGAVYDGLVAAIARHHGLHLLTRDRRARATYDAVGVAYTMI